MADDQYHATSPVKTNGQGDVVRFHRRYALLLLFMFLSVVIFFAIVIIWQDVRYERADLERLRKNHDRYVNDIDNKFNQLRHEMMELQASAEADLFESRYSKVPMPYAYRFLKDTPNGKAFHLNDVGPLLMKKDIGNLTGDGSIKSRSSYFYREIAMALKRMVDFDSLAKTIPELVWIYYYSKDNFAVYYPWVPSENTRFEKESYKLNAWFLGLPENNPRHEPYWTETYFDSVGKGLMVSCLVPIYDGNRFAGVIGSDLSVDFLNILVSTFEPDRGGMLILYDQFDNLLAHPKFISASDKQLKNIKEGLPAALFSKVERLKTLSEGQIVEINGWRVMLSPLMNAPYNSLYIEPVPSRIEALIKRIGFGTIALSFVLIIFLVVSLTITHLKFVRPSANLVRHILLKSQGKGSDIGKRVPSAWQPWFDLITRVFNKNAELISGMEIQNKDLQNEIKERKQAEEALRESEKRFRDTVEMLPEAIFEMDLNMKLTFVNQKGYEIIGYTKQDFEKGLNGLDMIAPEDRARVQKNVANRLQGIEIGPTEYLGLKKDGSVYPMILNASPVMNQGEPVGFRGILIDITDRKRTENHLQQAQKLESIGTLAGGIAHDFNNILSAILGYTELAMDDSNRGENAKENLQGIYIAGNRAKELVKQILAFARQSDEEIKPLKVLTIAKEALKLVRSAIPSSIEIRQALESQSLIMGNAIQIHQIFMNLFTNAAQSMEEEGGILEISLKDNILSQDLMMSRFGLPPNDYIQIKVSDTGTGIPPGNLESIFEPYFTTKPLGEGTGMGLSVVYGIVESHGGKIVVDSKFGKGTTFTIYLPILKAREVDHHHTPEILPSGTEHILFVDDEVSIASVSSRILESCGYKVTAQTSSVEALELFRSNPNDFDLVITDMTMPKLTGDKLAVELIKIRPDIPVILLTGYSKKISEERAKEIGIKAFAYKPVVKNDLARIIRNVLDEKR